MKTKEYHGCSTHGQQHPLYTLWAQMLNRCNSPTARGYQRYGGRGIRVCKRWSESFLECVADSGPRPSNRDTLDRYPNNDGNYEPGNVRWATPAEQSRNKRSNHLITFNGKTLCLTDWANEIGTTINVLRTRITLGWSVEKMLTTPVKAKIGADIASEIRSKLTARNGAALAREYGISRATVSMIRTGKIWQ